MPALSDIVDFLNTELKVNEIPDYPGAINGLQLENHSGEVTKVAAAVDATLPVVEKAIAAEADLLIVHHGMFWQGATPLTKATFSRISQAIEAGMAIYSCHIPLDIHPSLGNNALMARAIGMEITGEILPWKGVHIGLKGDYDGTRESLIEAVEAVTGSTPHVCPGGPEEVKSVGLATGGAGDLIATAAESGIDTFITGEGAHWSYTLAEELGVNLIYGGHYATETFGVLALALLLGEKFGIESEFIDHPTGL